MVMGVPYTASSGQMRSPQGGGNSGLMQLAQGMEMMFQGMQSKRRRKATNDYLNNPNPSAKDEERFALLNPQGAEALQNWRRNEEILRTSRDERERLQAAFDQETTMKAMQMGGQFARALKHHKPADRERYADLTLRSLLNSKDPFQQQAAQSILAWFFDTKNGVGDFSDERIDALVESVTGFQTRVELDEKNAIRQQELKVIEAQGEQQRKTMTHQTNEWKRQETMKQELMKQFPQIQKRGGFEPADSVQLAQWAMDQVGQGNFASTQDALVFVRSMQSGVEEQMAGEQPPSGGTVSQEEFVGNLFGGPEQQQTVNDPGGLGVTQTAGQPAQPGQPQGTAAQNQPDLQQTTQLVGEVFGWEPEQSSASGPTKKTGATESNPKGGYTPPRIVEPSDKIRPDDDAATSMETKKTGGSVNVAEWSAISPSMQKKVYTALANKYGRKGKGAGKMLKAFANRINKGEVLVRDKGGHLNFIDAKTGKRIFRLKRD